MRVLSIALILYLSMTAVAYPVEEENELERSLSLLNNGQLLEAYALLDEYNQENPEDPFGLLLLALSKWRMMWLSTYDSKDREELMTVLGDVEKLTMPLLKKDSDALFYFAAVKGVRAQVAATENRWWETAQLGKEMKKYAERLVKMDPNYYDAYYLLGSFNYFADALPGYLKFLRALVFLPGGDRLKGMKQLVIAYQQGTSVSVESGKTLAIIYTYYEGRHDYGLRMCDTILSAYPHSYEIGLYKGVNLYFSMSWEKCIDWMRSLHKDIAAYSAKHHESKENHDIVSVYLPMDREIRYWLGRAHLQLKHYDQARHTMMELAEPPVHQPYWLMRWVYLSLAQIEFEEGNDDAAEQWLEKVLLWKDVRDSQEKAKLLKKKKTDVDMFEIDFR